MHYLEWLNTQTPGAWWHDSAIPEEIDAALAMGAKGITTNPVLTWKTLSQRPDFWRERVEAVDQAITGEGRAEEMLKIVASYAAERLLGVYRATGGEHGYAFGQLSPALAGNREEMLAQGLRVASWGENIAVKVPTSRAALYVVEELAARGIAVCASLNFSVSQAMAVAEAYARGAARADTPKPCFVVQQGGRLEDYLRDVNEDLQLGVPAEYINMAGNIVTKRSCRIFERHSYRAVIMPAGLRGTRHLTEMAGARIVATLQSRVQRMLLEENPPQVERYQEEAPEEAVEALMRIPDFRRAFCEYALPEEAFMSFGVFQKTLSQFMETGWALLEGYNCHAESSRWF